MTIDYANKNILGTIEVDGKVATLVLEGGSLDGTGKDGKMLYDGIKPDDFPADEDIKRDDLHFAFYPRQACEVYIDDIQISYDDWKKHKRVRL